MYHPSLNRCLFAFLLLFLFLNVKSQSVVAGSVVNAKGEALAFANVVLLSLPDSSFITGTTTDEEGSFALSRAPGQDQLLAIHLLGFRSVHMPIPLAESSTAIPPIVLIEDGIELSVVKSLLKNH